VKLLESHQDQTSKSWDLVHRLPNRYDLAIGKFHREDLFLKYISKLSKSQKQLPKKRKTLGSEMFAQGGLFSVYGQSRI
jgi:hypothetical protein